MQQNRRIKGCAAAFEYAHGKPAVPGFEIEPQRRARCFSARLLRAEQHGEHWVAFGGQLQAPQLGIFNGAGPREHRAAGLRAQRLFGRPQRFARRTGGDDDDAREIDAEGGERRRVRQMRRRNPRECTFLRGQRGEGGAQYAQFADAFMLRQDFRQRRGRPAAAGQFRVERAKTGRHAGADDAA